MAITSQLSLAKKKKKNVKMATFTVNWQKPKNVRMAITSQLSLAKKNVKMAIYSRT